MCVSMKELEVRWYKMYEYFFYPLLPVSEITKKFKKYEGGREKGKRKLCRGEDTPA